MIFVGLLYLWLKINITLPFPSQDSLTRTVKIDFGTIEDEIMLILGLLKNSFLLQEVVYNQGYDRGSAKVLELTLRFHLDFFSEHSSVWVFGWVREFYDILLIMLWYYPTPLFTFR